MSRITSSALYLVVARELREAMRRKTFWIILAVAIAGSTAAVVLPEVLGGKKDTFTVGVVDGTPELRQALQGAGQALDAEVTITDVDSRDTATRQVEDGDLSIAIVAGDDPAIVATAGEDVPLVAAAQEVLAQQRLAEGMAESGVASDRIGALLSQPPVPVDERQKGAESRRGAAAIIAVVLYLVLLMLTLQVANGSAIEKANRISEVLLAIVRPSALLFGKVIAVGLVGFATLVGGALPVIVKLIVGGSLPEGLFGAILAGAAWYVLGSAFFLTLSGALGALVERQEEASGAASPLTMLILASYFIGQSASDTALGRVLAILPGTSTMVMPSRIAVGAASGPEIVLSLVLGVAAVVAAVRVGGTIYKRAVVRTGRRLKVKDVLRSG